MGEATSEPAHRLSATLIMSVAAVVAALIAIFGDKGAISWLTVVAAFVGLVPWALVAGGVRVPAALFAVMVLVPVAVIVLVAENPGGLFPAMLAVVWVTRTSASRALVGAVVGVSAALVIGLAVVTGSAHESGMAYFLGGIGIAWMAGSMLRRQEQLTDELRELHALNVEHAAVAERARVAREVHDVVAHSLTVVMLHLTGARRVLRSDPARADEALARAEDVGRESLDSIRQVVGLLRSTDVDGADVPLPGLAQVPALVEGYRAGGLRVTANVALDEQALEPAAGLAAYRIVQESLTNVLRHAPGADCSVDVVPDGDGRARITVTNAPPVHPAAASDRAGLGVRGMTERVRALGGELIAGPTPAGGWLVTATLPTRRGREHRSVQAAQPAQTAQPVQTARSTPGSVDRAPAGGIGGEAAWVTPTTAR